MANFYARYNGLFGGSGGGGGGVTSLNSETGDINLTSVDSSVTITPSGQTIDLSAQKLTTGNLTDVGTDGITIGNGSGAVVGSGTTISQHVADSTHNGYLSSTDWSTFNGKGSGTVTSVAMTVPSVLSISGSPVTGAGTLALTYSGTALPVANGGTGQVTAAAAFNALSPITTTGDMIYSPSGATSQRLAVGSTGNVLTVSGGVPTWAPPATSGTVTAVSVVSANGLAGSSSGGATPALTLSTTVTGVLSGNGTTISAASVTGSGAVVLATSPTITTPTIAKLANLTTNGYVKTSAGDGTLGVSTPTAAFVELFETVATASGDLIYGGASGTPTRLAKGSDTQVLTLASGVPTWAAAGGGSSPNSHIYVDGGNGHGGSSSGETTVRNYLNVRDNTGSDITYTARTTTAGDKYTINTTGVYSMTLADKYSSSSTNIGITVNTSSTTTNITSLSYANGFRGQTSLPTDTWQAYSITLHLTAADVVRVQDVGATDSSGSNLAFFSITRVS